MFHDLKISHRGLILVAAPLIVALFFTTFFFILLEKAEHDKKQEYDSKLLIIELSDIHQIFFDMVSMTVNNPFRMIGQTKSDDFPKFVKQVRERVALIKSRVGNDPHEQEHVRKIAILAEQLVAKLTMLRQRIASGEMEPGFVSFKDMRNELRGAASQMYEEVAELTDERRKLSAADPEMAENSWKAVKVSLGAFAVISVLLCVMSAVFFFKGITNRLLILSDNSTRLAEGSDLNPVMEGVDEIAHLDQVFHDMAKQLELTMHREKAVTDNAVDIICSVDMSGKFLKVNPASLLILGYPPEKLAGQAVFEVLNPEDRTVTECAFSEAREHSGEIRQIENRCIHEDGRTINLSWSLRWSEDEQAYFCVVHDITERVAVERLKQELLNMISHDIRTPISSISISLELLCNGVYGNVSDKVLMTMKSTEQTAQYVSSLIDNLLEVSRLESGDLPMQKESMILGDTLERAIEAVEPVAENREISIICSGSWSRVVADRERITQVIVNLLSNAVKYSEAGSTVSLEVAELHPFVEISVVDTGKGIPSEFQERIFDAFSQVEAADATKKKGFGLGLAICKKIIEQHGGRIGVRSVVGHGSTFWFTLPLVADTVSGAAHGPD